MENNLISRLMEITSTAAIYCADIENCREKTQKNFVKEMLQSLPKLYLDFSDPELDLGENDEYFTAYVDENQYNEVRGHLESLLGEHDVFLETFEEDMKYSDTPVAASISESLADIYQALFNFVAIVRDTDGESIEGAYKECRENFVSYWSQTLCNVQRALNHLYYNVELQDTAEGINDVQDYSGPEDVDFELI
ncbi:MAG: DUF5063 domain-containing protein [Muribaculaceae bacterium]|nr:DUF5063 domain-containing protein [Muribaculaceae bacterium]